MDGFDQNYFMKGAIKQPMIALEKGGMAADAAVAWRRRDESKLEDLPRMAFRLMLELLVCFGA